MASAERLVRETAAQAADALADAVSSLYEAALDRVLATPQPVRSAAEGRGLLASDEGAEALSDQVQKVVVAAVPIVRALFPALRLARIPWPLVASTSVSIAVAVRTGVREVQVLASLLAHRIEEATGGPPDPALVKKLAIELYLSPRSRPDVSDRRLRAGRLVRRWVFRGAIGRSTAGTAMRALEAAERLDLRPLLAAWERSQARARAR